MRSTAKLAIPHKARLPPFTTLTRLTIAKSTRSSALSIAQFFQDSTARNNLGTTALKDSLTFRESKKSTPLWLGQVPKALETQGRQPLGDLARVETPTNSFSKPESSAKLFRLRVQDHRLIPSALNLEKRRPAHIFQPSTIWSRIDEDGNAPKPRVLATRIKEERDTPKEYWLKPGAEDTLSKEQSQADTKISSKKLVQVKSTGRQHHSKNSYPRVFGRDKRSSLGKVLNDVNLYPKTAIKEGYSRNTEVQLSSCGHIPRTSAIKKIRYTPVPTSVESQIRTRMHSYVEILTTPTSDTPGTALLLHFDTRRYLIGNLHEGFQRATIQIGRRMLQVSNIFLTGKTEWQNVGGLVGIILTLADATSSSAVSAAEKAKQKAAKCAAQERPGAKESYTKTENPTLTIHGGPNITHTLATARKFVFRKGMPVQVDEYPDRKCKTSLVPDYVDDCIRVWTLAISPLDNIGGQSPGSGAKSPRKRSFNEFRNDYSKMARSLEPQTGRESSSGDQDGDQDRAAQEIRHAIVMDMFDSTYRRDELVETKFSDVELPATLFVRDAMTNKIEKYKGPMPSSADPMPDKVVLVRKPWPGANTQTLPATKPSTTALSYIFRNHPQRGKFLPEKAKALGLQPGPQWSKLAAGENVQSADGKTVTPDMVLTEGKEGSGIAVIDLPTTSYIQQLVDRKEWASPEITTGVEAFVWIMGPGVGQDPRIHDFIRRFDGAKHVVSSRECCTDYLAMESSAAAAIRLNQISPTHFPIPIHDNITLPQKGQPMVEGPTIDCIRAKRGHTIRLEPNPGLLSDVFTPPLNTALVLKKMPKAVLELANDAKGRILKEEGQDGSWKEELVGKDAEIICLGTGSAVPSKYRNVSGTLVRVPGCGSYLLDCGENTLGQMQRVFSRTEFLEVLRDLKVIWISHLHADHHLGTVAIIKAWYDEVYGKSKGRVSQSPDAPINRLINPAKVHGEEDRLCVVGPEGMTSFLSEYAMVEDFGYDKLLSLTAMTESIIQNISFRNPDTGNIEYRRIPISQLTWNDKPLDFHSTTDTFAIALRKATGLLSLTGCNVSHCWGAKAVSLTFLNHFKISYSGDCRPSSRFVQMGKYSTVLIHEATFDDELQGDAEAKYHSTTSEAITVGRLMRAKRILLTHFSQRYQKIPVMAQSEGKNLEIDMSDTEGKLPKRGLDTDLEVQEPKVDTDVDNSNTAQNLRATCKTSDQKPENPYPIRRIVQPSWTMKNMKVAVAFDYMRVKVGEIAHLEKFTPALLKLYAKAALEDDDATIERRSAQEVANIANRGRKVGEKMNQARKKSKGSSVTRGDKPKDGSLRETEIENEGRITLDIGKGGE